MEITIIIKTENLKKVYAKRVNFLESKWADSTEKSKHTKLEIQKAQQYIDEFLKGESIKKGEQILFETLADLQTFTEKYKPKGGEFKVECKNFFVLTKGFKTIS